MNLYAKTTSERASKGQGGNNQIEITLTIDSKERKEIGRVVMNHDSGTYTVYYYPINSNCTDQKINNGRVLLYQSKGEKKKDEFYTDTRGKQETVKDFLLGLD